MFLQFIIPYYGSADLLITAVNSILNQTDTDDIGLIVVDDNHFNEEGREQSTKAAIFLNNNRSGKVNIQYIKNDENLGVGKTRNVGLAAAHADYISFIDSDDEIDKEFVAYIKEKHAKRPCNVYVGYYTYSRGEHNFIDNAMTWLHGKVYKLQFLRRNNITFPPIRFNEDSGFNFMVYEMTKNIGEFHDGKIIYYWKNNDNSLTIKNTGKVYSLIHYCDSVTFAAERVLRKYEINNTRRIVPTIIQIYRYYVDILFVGCTEEELLSLNEPIQNYFDVIHDTKWYQSSKEKQVLADNFFEIKNPCIAIPEITFKQFVSMFEKETLNFR